MIIPAVVIPFRDRGTDPLRARNMDRVLYHWEDEHGWPVKVFSDGRGGKELFNRSAAYNRAIAALRESNLDADVLIFAESDMLIGLDQIGKACELALEHIGMVVPFTTYCYHDAMESEFICDGADPNGFTPRWKMPNSTSIGAINVMSWDTIDAVGCFDQRFEGNWYDDDAMKLACDTICGPTRFVDGKAHHLYHLPGHKGKHLTDMEKEATRRNQKRLFAYEDAAETNNVADMRRLLRGEV